MNRSARISQPSQASSRPGLDADQMLPVFGELVFRRLTDSLKRERQIERTGAVLSHQNVCNLIDESFQHLLRASVTAPPSQILWVE